MTQKPIVIVGAGPAGLIAAEAAVKAGAEDVLVVDRARQTGGILNQCIHAGFGLTLFKQEMTGPEFAARVNAGAQKSGVRFMMGSTVIKVTKDRTVTVLNEQGVTTIEASAVIMCTGCRERSRGAIHIPGERSAGIYTAGLAQRLVNINGVLPGKKIVILGSGDIGLIMARRMTLQGAKVLAVVEIMPEPAGLTRNIVECLDDFDIPLLLSHTVTRIDGSNRVESVAIARVNENQRPIAKTEFTVDCDTLMLSVGLIPENELAEMAGIKLDRRTNGMLVDENLMTTVEGIFGCGNALHVHDLVDHLAVEAAEAGANAAAYAKGEAFAPCKIPVTTDENFGFTVPYCVSGTKPVRFQFRVKKEYSLPALSANNGFRFRFTKLQPNQMASVMIPTENLANEEEVQLCLNV